MTNLVAYFKQRPKTALILIGAAVLLAAAVKMGDATYRLGTDSVSLEDASYNYGESAGGGSAGYPGKTIAPTAPSAMPPVTAERDMYYPTPQPSAGPTAAEVDQKIIKNGYLRMEVAKVADAAADITGIATARGGFIQSSSVTERGDGTYSGDISVRVPVEKFEETMGEIKKLATVVRHETSSGQDVTEQYTDLEAQLRNAKAQEEVYLEILKQAKTVEEILQVQQYLGQIRAQIESYEGRLKYLQNMTSYSTISVALEEEPVVRAPTKEFRLGAIVRDAVQVLVNAVQDLVAGLIYVVIVWGGILLPVGLVAWVVWKIWKRRVMR